ncbi:MAG TPA: hypothetical protein VJA47_01065 [archaeon]|nr:hypothetical protein [archaeon]
MSRYNSKPDIRDELRVFLLSVLGTRDKARVPYRESSSPLLLLPPSRHPRHSIPQTCYDERRGIYVAPYNEVIFGDKLDDPKVQQEFFDQIHNDGEILEGVGLPTGRIPRFHELSGLGKLFAAYTLAASREAYPTVESLCRVRRDPERIEPEDARWLSRLLVDEDVDWAANFKINGKDYVFPLTIEERDVVAAATYAAKLFYDNGGIQTRVNQQYPKAVGMIYFKGREVDNNTWIPGVNAKKVVEKHRKEILKMANEGHRHTRALDVIVSDDVIKGDELDYADGLAPPMNWVTVELVADPGESMGATTVSTMTEAIAPYIQRLIKADLYVGCVVSNSFGRLVEAEGSVKIKDLARRSRETGREWSGEEVAEGIAYLSEWSGNPHRKSTETKGILNGILSLGNVMRQDTRAIAAAVYNPARIVDDDMHPIPRFHGVQWKRDGDELRGRLKLPIPCGTVHKEAQEAKMYYKLLGIESADQLAGMMGAVGMATNLSALSMLSTIGITEGRKRGKEIAKK